MMIFLPGRAVVSHWRIRPPGILIHGYAGATETPLDPIAPSPSHPRVDPLRRHGFQPGPSHPLHHLAGLAAALCGAPAQLILRDEDGPWFREEEGVGAVDPCALRLAERLELVAGGRSLGWLDLLGPGPLGLTLGQRQALRLLADHICALVAAGQEVCERRAVPRGPSGASFVPGLVHELHNFTFGLSASLDAFQARFHGQEEVLRYGRVMLGSLERLNGFLEELRLYGDPSPQALQERNLEPLLQEAAEQQRLPAARAGVTLQVRVAGPLPPLRADGESLRSAFGRVLELALQQESEGGCVVLHAGVRSQEGRQVLFGYVDGTGLRLTGLDLDRLFEPFYFRASGLGRLALPVARRIFEAHGGNLSAGPGPEGGMRIGFMLPASA